MDVIYERCCGLDVQRTVVACLIVAGTHGEPRKEIRTFGTMRLEDLELTDWLAAAGCTHEMESTGVYWKPIYNLLVATYTSCFWSTPGTSRPSRGARPTSRIVSGSLIPPGSSPDWCWSGSSSNLQKIVSDPSSGLPCGVSSGAAGVVLTYLKDIIEGCHHHDTSD